MPPGMSDLVESRFACPMCQAINQFSLPPNVPANAKLRCGHCARNLTYRQWCEMSYDAHLRSRSGSRSPGSSSSPPPPGGTPHAEVSPGSRSLNMQLPRLINPKQYARIMKRRAWRKRFYEENIVLAAKEEPAKKSGTARSRASTQSSALAAKQAEPKLPQRRPKRPRDDDDEMHEEFVRPLKRVGDFMREMVDSME